MVFEVVAGTGAPLPGVTVDFFLSTEVGGLAVLNSSAVSGPLGRVTAFVSSGDVATAVRVIATIDLEDDNGNVLDVSTVSDLLVVSTGLPDQNSFSISSEFLNVAGAANIDGLESTITIRMADKFNNPVPDSIPSPTS